MADEKKAPHSLREQSADQIRNEQRGGASSPIAPEQDGGAEGNASMRRVWSQPGGEANNYRNAMVAAGTKTDNHGELTAAETPETTRHLSDASLGPTDKDATAEAIERATAVNGQHRGEQGPSEAAPGAEDAASTLGQGGGDEADGANSGQQSPTPTTHTLRNPGGLASNLQRGGTMPGGGPGGSVGSIGTGGGSTAGAPSGSAKRRI